MKDQSGNQALNRRRFLAQAAGGACALCGAGVAVSLLRRGADGEAAPSLIPLNAAAAENPAAAASGEERFIAPARYWEDKGETVLCKLCPRECSVPRDERGYCGVRENRGGQYRTLVHSRVCSPRKPDPIEKKPFFHFLPATMAYSLSTAGCNVECKFCQNWQISQMRPEQLDSLYFPPQEVVRQAKQAGCPSIAFTYTEPVVFSEYVLDTAAEARKQGVHAVMVSNGFIQRAPMEALCKELSAVKIDLKGFREEFYRDVCHGQLKPVMQTLETLKRVGIWFEIVVLIIPTLNDGDAECRDMCRWIKSALGPDVPIHFTRFGPMYKLTNLPPTPVETLERNHAIARAEGLHYPYIGNVPGHAAENTYCHGCSKKIVERYGFVSHSRLRPGGLCPDCGVKIPGVWV